jgi:hypothetical protein
MKEYYFLENNEQNGPFTIEQLTNKGLSYESLIWTEGMKDWQKLKDFPELVITLKPRSVPPPPPKKDDGNISKTEVSGQLKVTTEKTPNPTLEAIKPSRQALTLLILWCSFHLFALLMSYSEIDEFNRSGNNRTEEFWPMVEFEYCSNKQKTNDRGQLYYVEECIFEGYFNQYD